MPKKFSQRAEDLRRALAQEAARLMAEHGIDDFLQAKRKAADRLGVNDVAVLPKNVEIESGACANTSASSAATPTITASRNSGGSHSKPCVCSGSSSRGWWARCSPARPPTTATSICTCSPTALNRSRSACMEIGVPHEFYERRVKMDAERSVNYPALRFEAERPHRRCHGLPDRRHPPVALFAGGRPADAPRRRTRSIRTRRTELNGAPFRAPLFPARPPACPRNPGRARRCP